MVPAAWISQFRETIKDKHLGVVRREIYYGIIDYITEFDVAKVIESSFKKTHQKNPSAINPTAYAGRFINMVQTVFKTS